MKNLLIKIKLVETRVSSFFMWVKLFCLRHLKWKQRTIFCDNYQVNASIKVIQELSEKQSKSKMKITDEQNKKILKLHNLLFFLKIKKEQ